MAIDEKAWAIILAAGSGSRMGIKQPKQFIKWRHKPLYWISALAFSHCACIGGLVIVLPEKYLARESEIIARLSEQDHLNLPCKIIPGGKTRQESSKLGIDAVPLTTQIILIHDAARPFLTPALVWRVYNAISSVNPCVIPAIPVRDTIKITSATDASLVETTLPRSRLAAIQTPQGFIHNILRTAHLESGCETVTDDAALIEKLGYPVKLVEGEENNIKITNPEDMKYLEERDLPIPVTGFGYDVHKFGHQRPLKLGGIEIPCNFGVLAHSDGDVLLHALIDAILGCASLGDIGQLFPDDDPKYEGINSAILLDHTISLAVNAKITLTHIDLTVVTQKPRLNPWRGEIRKNISRLLGMNIEQINFKATTEEGLGFTGNMAGIKAYAIVNGLKYGTAAKSETDE